MLTPAPRPDGLATTGIGEFAPLAIIAGALLLVGSLVLFLRRRGGA